MADLIENKYCFCDSISSELRIEQGIPEGFCGICEVCGKPGHAQHYPGSVPYTGAWCESCLAMENKWGWVGRLPLYSINIIFYVLIIIWIYELIFG
jgi:hypothetical protein